MTRHASAPLLRSMLAGVLCTGILGLAALAAGRGLLKPPAPAAELQQIDVVLRTDVIDPAFMLLLPGPVHFEVRNMSGVARVFRITGPGVAAATAPLQDGQTGNLDVTFARPGTYFAGDGRNHAAAGSIRVRLP